MKVVVLAGGTSTERDVSIVSGTGICKALRQRGHQAILLDVFFGKEGADSEKIFLEAYDVEKAADEIRSKNARLSQELKERRSFFGPNVMELCQAADVVFLGLHGANGEDGRIQAVFDLYGIKYTGTDYLSSAMAMDKGITKELFRIHGVPTPKGVQLQRGTEHYKLSELDMELPVVVKTCCGGSSIGVYIVHTEQEYEEALTSAFGYEEFVIVEEYIQGREFSVGVVDGEAYPVIELEPKEGFYDYKNKYLPGAVIETCPANLSEELTKQMQEYAILGCKALGIEGYARLDFLLKENGAMYCLEANTLPGMTPTSLLPQEAAAIGIDYSQLCEKLIEISMKKYK